MWVPAFESFQAGQPEHFLDSTGPFCPRKMMEPESNIVGDTHVWKQRIFLEDHPDTAFFGRHGFRG